MILGIPHRHDLVEYSCVNKAVWSFSYKLKKVAKNIQLCLHNRV
jgi:hypothetical protein